MDTIGGRNGYKQKNKQTNKQANKQTNSLTEKLRRTPHAVLTALQSVIPSPTVSVQYENERERQISNYESNS